MDHTAIRVPDFDTAVRWYAEKLDLRLRHSAVLGGLTFGLLYPAAGNNFHIEILAGPGADDRPVSTDLRASYKMPGWHHLGFTVPSVDDSASQLRERGVTIVSEPHDVIAMRLRVAFFADPWGNLFELTQPLAAESHV